VIGVYAGRAGLASLGRRNGIKAHFEASGVGLRPGLAFAPAGDRDREQHLPVGIASVSAQQTMARASGDDLA
jgi:hypothetical protein